MIFAKTQTAWHKVT